MESIYHCEVCKKNYKSRQSLWYHTNKFHTRKITKEEEMESNKDNLINKQRKEIEELKNRNKELEKQVEKLAKHNKKLLKKTSMNNKTIINNNNIVINNITYVKFGQESFTVLTRDEIEDVLNHGFHSLCKLVELMHLNPRLPAMNNIKITNLKNKYCQTFNGEMFVTGNKKEVIGQLIQNRNIDLETLYESYRNKYNNTHNSVKHLVDQINQHLLNKNKRASAKYLKSIRNTVIETMYDKQI